MGKFFGTDGVRGIAGEYLTSELAMKIGAAAGLVLKSEKDKVILIGRDTRVSGAMLANAIGAGLMSQGFDVIDLGIVPTPAVSYLIEKYNATAGVMISASHNPSEYNGIKIFNHEGYKLPDELEDQIEEYLLGKEITQSTMIGTYKMCDNAIKDYVEHLFETATEINKDLKVVVDCAYGSASTTAPLLFEKLGLKAILINTEFDGYNINKNAGSTHLEGLIEQVKNKKADIGIAYDGDADRCLLVNELGEEVDGDEIMAITSFNYKKQDKLNNNTLVGTVMSNIGLVKFCNENDITFVATKVGDKYVLENMLENNYTIGGEQSGHVIFKNFANTGDGELTSVQILNILSEENKKLSEIASIMKKYPQVLVNVKVTDEAKKLYKEEENIKNIIKEIEDELKDDGRVLIRPSGTEPLIRVMIEGVNQEDITIKANKIADAIKEKFSEN